MHITENMQMTTVIMTKETRRRLAIYKAERSISYNDAINTLLDLVEKQKAAEQSSRWKNGT